MNRNSTEIRTVTLAYFSGTGCTKAVVDCFEKRLIERNRNVQIINIADPPDFNPDSTDLLILFSPVYAFQLASPLEKWAKNLPSSKGTRSAIISVSGGGEVSPNTACRVRCKKYLNRKNYTVNYEKMLVMPSNFAIEAPLQLNLDLIKILPLKVDQMINDLLAGRKNLTQPILLDRFLVYIGKLEHLGARLLGACLYASKDCNHCGLCAHNCPVHNIRLNHRKAPKFGFRCVLCMKCIYSCPCHAITLRIFKFFILKDGFNLKRLTQSMDKAPTDTLESNLVNKAWQGAINYLKEK